MESPVDKVAVSKARSCCVWRSSLWVKDTGGIWIDMLGIFKELFDYYMYVYI